MPGLMNQLSSQLPARENQSPNGSGGADTSTGSGDYGGADETATTGQSARDDANGAMEQQQQAQAQQAMQDVTMRFQAIVVSAQQLSDQITQMAEMYPVAQETLGPAMEMLEGLKQAVLQSMMAAVQAVQAPEGMPPQV